MYIGLRLYLLVPLAAGTQPAAFAPVLRVLHVMQQWNTLEVLTVSAMLALVRIAALADASPGAGLFALGALSLLLAGIDSAGLKHLWLSADDGQPGRAS
jgi:paraquat-inducible protein A